MGDIMKGSAEKGLGLDLVQQVMSEAMLVAAAVGVQLDGGPADRVAKVSRPTSFDCSFLVVPFLCGRSPSVMVH
eukprot:SAG31_NODE_2686_length_5253_cov_84.469926_5_plen_74_part_00